MLQLLIIGAILNVSTGLVIQKWHISEDGSQFYIENERKVKLVILNDIFTKK